MTNHFPSSSVFCDKRSSCAWKPPTNRFMAFFHFRFFPFKSVFPRPFFTLHPSSFVQASDKFTAESFCVCVCVGCFDVRLADTAAYLKHVISTYLQYIIFILFCFFLVVQDIHSKLIFLVTVYLHQTCSLTANGYSCVIPPGRGGGGDFGNRMLLICFEICGL